MKFKWNWLDTVIVVIVLLVIAAVCFFFMRPGTAGGAETEKEWLITFETPKNVVGTYDNLKVGDTVYLTDSNTPFGVIESVEILPSQNSVFDEKIKNLVVGTNEAFPVCRFTIKTSGYKNEDGELYLKGTQILFRTEYYFETPSIRLAGLVYDSEVTANEIGK